MCDGLICMPQGRHGQSLGLNICDKQCYMGQLIGPIEGV